jgi:hypothetical protein
VGVGGWQTLAAGTVTLDPLTQDWVFALDTGFANTIDEGQYPATVYDVSEVASVTIVGDLTFTGLSMPTCMVADINCDGYVDNGDYAVLKNGANWLSYTPANPRAELNGVPPVDNGDYAFLKNGANWLQSTGPCICPP